MTDPISKPSSEIDISAYKHVFVLQAGPYAGRIMLLKPDQASAAIGDGWAAEVDGALYPNETPATINDQPAQSYLDWLADAAPAAPQPAPEE